MIERRVWAPFPARVDLVVGQRNFTMTPVGKGWWSTEIDESLASEDYAFSLDGSSPLPDPRSQWQPHGVHGQSRTIDHLAFRWSDSEWQARPLSSAVIYECHIGTFTPEGTFDGAIDKLDYLVDLGISHLELMPVAEFPGSRGWGYDGVDLYAPHHAYGGPDGLKRLVDACHARGIAIILDVVYNHFGPDGNYLSRFGPYLTDRYTTPWGDAVNLDGPDSDEVRRFFCDNALMWLRDYHFDGLRLDAVHAIFDNSAEHFLEQLVRETSDLAAGIGKHSKLIAESDLNQPRIVTVPEAGGYGLHAQWSDDFHHAVHAFLTGESSGYYQDFGSLTDLAKALRHVFVYDGNYSSYRKRNHGRPAWGLPAQRFVTFTQNHDQIGNRAAGERLCQLVQPAKLELAAALLLTSPFIPMLFQGEEWACSSPFQYFTDHTNPELARAVSAGRQREYGLGSKPVPDPQSIETFTRSKLNWDELGKRPHRDIYNVYAALLQLRRQIPDLVQGDLHKSEIAFDESARWLSIKRGACYLVFNFSEIAQPITLASVALTLKLVHASRSDIVLDANRIEMPKLSFALLLSAKP